MRVLLHQQAVLERARLGLVGVAAEVLVHRPLGDEGRLLAHREAGAAAAAQARVLELGQHRLGGHLEQRLAQRPVAAEALVDVDGVEARLVDVASSRRVSVTRPPPRARAPRWCRGRAAQAASAGSSSGSSTSGTSSTWRSSHGAARGVDVRLHRRPRPLGDACGLLVAGIRQAAPGERLAALDQRGHELARVALGERADVAAVDRRHRCHVARAQALELAQLDVLEPLLAGLRADRLVDGLGVAQVAGDAGAHVDVAAPDRTGCAACRRRWRRSTGRRA